MSFEMPLKACIKCPKLSGQVLCGGCQQWFCMKHLSEHRQNLSQNMGDISHQHDQLLQNLIIDSDDHPHSLMTRVDRWESRAIQRIKQVANKVRQELRKELDELKNTIQESLKQITHELQEKRETEAFTEFDLNRWAIQLKQFRDELETPSMIEIRNDENQRHSTCIPLIRLRILKRTVPSHINNETRWSTKGQTVAGGHGRGSTLNQLHRPYGFDIDSDGSLLIADWGNDRIIRWKPKATEGEILVGKHGRGDRTDQLNGPAAVLFDRINHQLVISDEDNRRVLRFSYDQDRDEPIDGQVIMSNIRSSGLAMDNEGSLYVSDYEKHEVRRYGSKDGKEGVIVAGGNGQGAALNQLHCPRHIFVDDDQSVYISDMWNHRVMKWTRNSQEGIIVAGGQGEGKSFEQLKQPNGIIVDRMGSIYVVDQFNHRLMRWFQGAQEGEVILGGDGRGSQNNLFNQPASITLDSEGNLYIADMFNDRIQRFDIQ